MEHIPEAVIYNLPVPTVLLMSWLVVLVLAALSYLATRRLELVPGGVQNAFELAFEFVYGVADSTAGKEAARFYPLFIGLFLYIFACNLLGLIPGMMSPTASLNTTVALALIVFFSTHYFGIRKQGLFRYLKNLTHGVPAWLAPLMFVLEFISELARPLSLSFRLFGNLMGKEILLAIFALLTVMFFPSHNIVEKSLTIVPLLLRPAIILLGMLVSFIQAFVFTMLAVIYIGGAVRAHSE